MKVVLLKDCAEGKAGQTVWIKDWNKAAALVKAGIARRLTWRDTILAQ